MMRDAERDALARRQRGPKYRCPLTARILAFLLRRLKRGDMLRWASFCLSCALLIRASELYAYDETGAVHREYWVNWENITWLDKRGMEVR